MRCYRLLQITDCHLMAECEASFRKQPVYQNLKNVIADAKTQQADMLLLTGDLAEQPKAVTYQHYLELLQHWPSSIYFIPGNHDDPTLMHQVFAEQFCTTKSVSVGNWQIVLLNSKLPYDSGEGAVDDGQIDFLIEQLNQYPEKFFLLVLHHHVLPTQGHMDKYGLQNQADFLTLLEQYQNIKIVLSGHIHQEFNAQYNGIQFLGTPATSYQIKPQQAHFMFDDISKGYRVIDLFADGTFATSVLRVP
jgi:Icc protein